eukprot:scaffold1172_cov409-Prasinococcus_capsulatus_cf.AAC.10
MLGVARILRPARCGRSLGTKQITREGQIATISAEGPPEMGSCGSKAAKRSAAEELDAVLKRLRSAAVKQNADYLSDTRLKDLFAVRARASPLPPAIAWELCHHRPESALCPLLREPGLGRDRAVCPSPAGGQGADPLLSDRQEWLRCQEDQHDAVLHWHQGRAPRWGSGSLTGDTVSAALLSLAGVPVP